jgi:hypothetical protein
MFDLFDKYGADTARYEVLADREFKVRAEIDEFKAHCVNEHQAITAKSCLT